MAGFEVITYGRFWVIAEGVGAQPFGLWPRTMAGVGSCPKITDYEAKQERVSPTVSLATTNRY
jgi:hypothetical protein